MKKHVVIVVIRNEKDGRGRGRRKRGLCYRIKDNEKKNKKRAIPPDTLLFLLLTCTQLESNGSAKASLGTRGDGSTIAGDRGCSSGGCCCCC